MFYIFCCKQSAILSGVQGVTSFVFYEMLILSQKSVSGHL